MFNRLNSLVCSCITPYSNLIRLALYFKKISLSALSGSSRARCSVMTPPAVLKRRSEGTKRTEQYPAEISGTWYHFGRNRSRIRKNGRISGCTSLVQCIHSQHFDLLVTFAELTVFYRNILPVSCSHKQRLIHIPSATGNHFHNPVYLFVCAALLYVDAFHFFAASVNLSHVSHFGW